jgi:hypothetical protein
MCVWCGSQDPALCTMDYDLFRCLGVSVPAAPGRLDTPLTRVRASGARNEGGLRRTRRNDPDAQLLAHPPKLGERHLSGTTFCFRGGAHVYILPIGVEIPRGSHSARSQLRNNSAAAAQMVSSAENRHSMVLLASSIMFIRQPRWPRSPSHTYLGSHSLAEVARKKLGSSDTRSRKNIPIAEFFNTHRRLHSRSLQKPISDTSIFSQLRRKFRMANLPQDLKWFQHVCAEDNFLAQPGTV